VLAGDKELRYLQSSGSESLTIKIGRKCLLLKIGCSNARTMLRAGKLGNVKLEMLRLEISVMGL